MKKIEKDHSEHFKEKKANERLLLYLRINLEKDIKRRKGLGERARQVVQDKFSSEVFAKRYYQEIIEKTRINNKA